jgi:hypothetical protein
MSTNYSSPMEYYLRKLVVDAEEQRRRADASETVFTDEDRTVASVIGTLYGGLENEKWIEGGPSKFFTITLSGQVLN